MESQVPIRHLGCMEEYVWLLEQHSTRMALVCAEIEGSTTLSQWEDAIQLLPQAYPNTSMRVATELAKRPYFVRSHGDKIPLRHLPLATATDVLEECRRQMEHSFGDGSGPPLRVTLMLGATRAAEIFAAHHAFFDGMGLMNMIRDTLRFLAGSKEPTPQLPSPSMDALAGLAVTPNYAPVNENDAPVPTAKSMPLFTSGPPKVSRIELSQELTTATVACAREHGTTANGILMASVFSAGVSVDERWRKEDFTCVVPANVRSLLNQEQAEGILFGQKRFVFDLLQPVDFWEIARACSEGIKELRTLDGLSANLLPLHDFLAVKRSVAEAVALASAYPHDLMVSNFGSFEGPTQFGSLKLKSVTPIVDSGDAHTQTVMVATTGDVMTIVLVSPNPLRWLLTSLEQQLAEKCMLTRTLAYQNQ